MNEYPDNELINMVCENNEEASDMLYNKYNYIVTAALKKVLPKARRLGIEYEELKQEALVGFSDALVSFNQDKDASLRTFITLCVERRLNNYIKKMETFKEKVNKETISLDQEIDEDKHSLYEIYGGNEKNPESTMIENEEIDAIFKTISKRLSNQEKEVLKLLIDGYKSEDIATKLNIPIKSVYNYVSRLRNKIKDI